MSDVLNGGSVPAALQMHPMTDSHLLVTEFAYAEPVSVDEVIRLLAEKGDRARLLAGGTYLLIQMKMAQQAPEFVISLARVPGLRGLTPLATGGLRIGAMTSIRELMADRRIQVGYPALAQACAAFGSTQIQIMGTIGGNVCNGSPASDAVPALMALDARLVLVGPEGERSMPVADFLVQPGVTAIRPGEILVAIDLPPVAPGSSSSYVKISRVTADLAKASVAVWLRRDGERVADCRIALGSVGPTVLRVKDAEAFFTGSSYSAEIALAAGQRASQEISPIDDVRSTAWYRREVTKALTHDALQIAWDRAGRDDLAPDIGQDVVAAPPADLGVADSYQVGPNGWRSITLTVNGTPYTLDVTPNELLVNVLRERLALTGTKYGCGIGECGACTVQLNGRPALSCLVLAVTADGADVTTVEGLAGPNGELDPLQDAFIEYNAFQCGYCTPGMLIMTKSLLREISAPGESDIRDWLKGNRCRCTGFASIVRAVEAVVDRVPGDY